MANISKEPRIATIAEKKLVGQYVSMSFADNKTPQLFQGFMPRRREVLNAVNADIICMQIYSEDFNINNFTTETPYQKWAVVEVSDFDNVPAGMETFTLPEGEYAVFHYIGSPSDFAPSFRYIFEEWLPASGYEVDHRPHFEILGALYKNNQPDSEEDIYVPVRLKG